MVKELKECSRKTYDFSGENIDDDEIQSGCQQRMADALEDQSKISERGVENQAKAVVIQEKLLALQERMAVAYEAAVQDKIDLVVQNQAFRKTNIQLQEEVKKSYAERDQLKAKLKLLSDEVRVKHLYRRIAALKGVIARMKKR